MLEQIKEKFHYEINTYIISLTIIIGIPFIKLLSYCLYLSGVIPDSFIIKPVYLLWLCLPLLILNYIAAILYKKIKINKLDIISYLLILFAFLSTIFAINKNVAIYGFYHRDEGLLSLLSYYMIFLNVKNIKNKKIIKDILKIALFIGIIQFIYAFLQVYTNFPFIQHYLKPYMAMGLCANPNFLGSYMVMYSLFTVTLYMYTGKLRFLILSTIFFWGICLAASTGPFLGFLITYIFLAILLKFIKKLDIKRLSIITIIFVSIFFVSDMSVNFVQKNIFNNTIWDNYNIKAEIEKIDLENFGNGRLEIWLNSLQLIPDNLLVGTGLDNFAFAYSQICDTPIDKAHNVYLQILITNGIFAFLTYLLLCLIIFLGRNKIKRCTNS